MATEFNMKRVTSPLLLHMLRKELRFPRAFLLSRKLTVGRFSKSIDKRFPRALIELAALPIWVYLGLKKEIGQHKAFEVLRVALLTGGTAAQNLQFDTVHTERTFDNFADLEIANNRGGLVRWNTMEVVQRTPRRFEITQESPCAAMPNSSLSNSSLPFHDETVALVHAPIERAFARLDDPMSLAAHMGKSSMMMLGSKMSMQVDAAGGRAIESKIRMHGTVLGIPVSLEEVIIERQAPYRKRWQTIGSPRLLVIAHYCMGFELTPKGDWSQARIFIDYSLPTAAPGSWLGRLFGGVYAHWCTKQMADDAVRHFDSAMSEKA